MAIFQARLVVTGGKVQLQMTNPLILGVDFHVKSLRVDEKNVAVQLWDTAGQERYKPV